MAKQIDVVDVHVTSIDNVVDAFTQYPLLDGQKKYTVELTEFVCPIASQEPLQSEFSGVATGGRMFEIRRKRRTADGVAIMHDNSRLTTLLPANIFTNDRVYFEKNAQRPMQSPGDLVYHLQRFFDDILARYRTTAVAATITGAAHGGVDVVVDADTRFVTCQLQPNGTLRMFFSPVFTKNFFLAMTPYGTRVLGIGTQDIVAFRTAAGATLEGETALSANGLLIEGGTDETVEYPARYPLERYFDRRIRLEVESQIGLPPTVVWSTDERQKISHVIATFPIQIKSKSSVLCTSEGGATDNVRYQSSLLVGDITWRRAEDKISERYLLNSSQFFHNIRLEIHIVMKNWEMDTTVGKERFIFRRAKMSFQDGESWTAKLRFRSIK